MSSATLGFAAPISLEGRFVPVQVSADSMLAAAGQTAQPVAASAVLQTKFVLTEPESQHLYGLLAAGGVPVRVYLNGKQLDTKPLPRQDGPLFVIDPSNLRAGENELQIVRTRYDGESWVGTAMFSFLDSIEEAHPNLAFDDRPADKSTKGAPKQVPPDAVQLNYDVLWYDCTFKPNFVTGPAQLLPGTEVTMRATALVNNFQTVVLNFDLNPSGNPDGNGAGSGMVITQIDQGPATAAIVGYTTTQVGGAVGTNINIPLPSPIAAGTEFTIRVQYNGYPNDVFTKQIFGSDPFERSTHAGIPVIYSASQPYGGRRWWPCKDTPSDKATTSIQRIIVPQTHSGQNITAVSNGKLIQTIPSGSDNIWVWRNDYPIATYLISLAASNYQLVQTTYTGLDTVTTMPVGHYIYPEAFGIEGTGPTGTLQVMDFYSSVYGEYPFLTDKYLTASWNITFAIEHQTCTSMPSGATAGVGNGKTRRNVHELAHQWFGDKMTCAHWDHTWLNEGFAKYSEALVTEALGPLTGIAESNLRDYMNSLGASTTVAVVNGNADDFASTVVYNRGAWVLHMLRHVLGDAAFFEALKDWAATGYTVGMSQPADSTVNFQNAVEQSAGLTSGSLSQFFTQWLYSRNGGPTHHNRPRYYGQGWMSGPPSGSNVLNVGIGQTQTNAATFPFHMPVDVRLTFENSTTATLSVLNSSTTETTSINVGGSYPLEIDLDPSDWILKDRSLTLNTVGLPSGSVGIPYSRALRGSSGSTPYTWSLRAGAPAWLSIVSGVLSGTPPAIGTYIVPIRLTDNVATIRDANLYLQIEAAAPPPAIVINEVMYENWPSGGDSGEYIELFNGTGSPQDISGWQVVLVNSAGTSYAPGPVTIPGSTTLASGDYYVIGNAATINAAYLGVVDQNVALDGVLSNGAPAGVVLKDDLGVFVDSLCYRADSIMGGGTESSNARSEGGIGRSLSRAVTIGNVSQNSSLGRLPNGTDSQSNLHDFANIPMSPGAANTRGYSMTLSDNFNSGPNAAWRAGFISPVRSVTLGTAGKPPADVAKGVTGQALEVYDSTGGGDVAYLPGDFNQLNFEGYIWKPADVGSNGWSTGVGIGTRCESTWMSPTAGNGIESGFYLEYQNGPLSGTNMKNGAIPAHSSSFKFYALNGEASLNTGGAGNTVVMELGTSSTAGMAAGWHKFRLMLDIPNNTVLCWLDDTTVLYEGALPSIGMVFPAGGVVVGFREQHPNLPGPLPLAANEGTWIDNVLINADVSVPVGLSEFLVD